jgi:hypothetical protein
MDLNKLKLGLTYIFFESKLSKNTKTQLINFIEQADAHQLKVLAMDGEIVATKQLDESARQIIDDRFDDALAEKLSHAALKGIKEAVFMMKEGMVGDIKDAMKKERAIKKSKMSPEQKKAAWNKMMRADCMKNAKRKNLPPEVLKKCLKKYS